MYPAARSCGPWNAFRRPARAQFHDKFLTRANALVQKAETLSPPERLNALAEALRVWPTLEGAADKYAAAFEAPALDVAVIDLPRSARPLGPRRPTPG